MELTTHTPTLSVELPRQERLLLVPFLREDLPTLYGWFNTEGVYRFNGGSPIADRYTLQDVLDADWGHLKPGQTMLDWAIRMGDNTLIGNMTVRLDPNRVAHWQLSVIGPEHLRGEGFGRLAKTAALDHLFDVRGVKEVLTAAHPDNKASRAFNAHLGFVPTSTENLALTADAWQRVRRTLEPGRS